jgi:molybdopterin/thiamine biosynthesis adenylyltransferase
MTNARFKISIIGAGGLGTPAAWKLATQWPTSSQLELEIYDPDNIELSNLNRQVLFSHQDLAKPKAKKLTENLAQLLPIANNIKLTSHQLRIDQNNIEERLGKSDFVIEATDSTSNKFLVNDFCLKNAISLCYCGVVGTSGLLFPVIPKLEPTSACLRCLFENFGNSDYELQTTTCQQAGIFGPVAGLFGFLQAQCAMDWLLNPEPQATPMLSRFSFDTLTIHQTKVSASPDCPNHCLARNNPVLNLTDKKCPETFLYAKLAMERIATDKTLVILFGNEESNNNVSKSLRDCGYRVIESDIPKNGEPWKIFVNKA